MVNASCQKLLKIAQRMFSLRTVRFAAFAFALLVSSRLFALTIDPYLTLTAPVCTNGQVQFSLVGEPGATCIIESSSDLQNWTPEVTNYDGSFSRIVTLPAPDSARFYRVRLPFAPILAYAVAADGNINFNGSGMVADSFNSADPNSSTNGKYDSTKASTERKCCEH